MILSYRHYSENDGEDTPANPQSLLILHGFLGSSSNWQSFSKSMAGHFSVFALDMRSHGNSPYHPEFSFTAMATDTIETIEHFRNRGLLRLPVHILGHSMGGKVAIKALGLKPEFFDKVVVVDISIRGYQTLAFVEKLSVFYHTDVTQFSDRAQLEDVVSKKVADTALIKFLMKNVRIDPQTKRLAWAIPFSELYEKRNALKEDVIPASPLSHSALFLRGEKSPYITQEDENLIKTHLPNASVKTIANAGHWAHADNPSATLTAALSHLGHLR